eukprot:5825218-Amphidinium_carterae.1
MYYCHFDRPVEDKWRQTMPSEEVVITLARDPEYLRQKSFKLVTEFSQDLPFLSIGLLQLGRASGQKACNQSILK